MLKSSLIAIGLCTAFSIQAVKIEPYLNTYGKVNILITGDINSGDFKALRLLMSRIADAGLDIDTIMLNSPGGLVNESIGMSYSIKSSGADTYTGVNQLCASSCFLLFAAGNNRYISNDSKIGVHQISIGGQSTLSTLGLSVQMSDLYDFFKIPENISYKMLKTAPSDVYWLNAKDKAHFNFFDSNKFKHLKMWDPELTKSTPDSASADSLFKLATINYLGLNVPQNYLLAKSFYEQAAIKGSMAALHKLGVIYFRGYGVPKNVTKSQEYWEKSAAGNYGASLSNLAVLEESRNVNNAIRMHEKLTSSQYDNKTRSFSYNSLGRIFYNQGNNNQAIIYFKKGAMLGDSDSQYMYGSLLLNKHQGNGEALSWINTACAGGSEEACQALGYLY